MEVPSRSIPDSSVLFSGRADWSTGYSSKNEDEALLVAVEVKQSSEFSGGESQLITSLAILRETRGKAGKTDITSQGFYDVHFEFVCIEDNGLNAVPNLGYEN